MKAIWNNQVLAESEATIVIENNHYFPADSVKKAFLSPSETTTVCGWKGIANYYHVTVNGEVNQDAAWYYPNPKEAAVEIANYVAFWRGVEVVA